VNSIDIPFTIAADSGEAVKGAWKHLLQQIERAERALAEHVGAGTQEDRERTLKAVKHYDTLVVAASQALLDELRDEKNRLLGLAA
jgi:hypothetical protein